jgi:2,4-dienoyl-CoA reductase-like NADH-dependent reductase (Old Yellow Enzyme family)
MPHLFEPHTLRSVTFRNRVVMSPMCMYSAGKDGVPNSWHYVHLGARAVGGVGLVIAEATSVQSRGRLSEADLGLYTDEQAAGFEPIVRFCQEQGARFGIQLAHGGRKAWSALKGDGPEQPVAPSALPFDNGWATPRELTHAMIDQVVADWRAAAERAVRIGVDMLEIHAAHGYLLHSFLSPLSNRRTDQYGGSLENRSRLHRRVAEAVRSVLPEVKPLFMRLSCSDWVEGGLGIEEVVEVSRWSREWGVDLIDCSSGGNSPLQQTPLGPGYQVPFAAQIRREAGIATGAVGLITEPEHADYLIRSGSADMILLGRELLRNPYWVMHAAAAMKAEHRWPVQYGRAKR